MIFDRTTQYQAYNMATMTVPKTKQIVMLYDGAIRFMQQAKDACIEKRIEDRYNLLVRAGDVVLSLQNSLDHENGGQIAKILYDYYASIDMRILSIHRSNSPEMCERVIAELKEMRNAWNHIDTSGAQPVAIPAATSSNKVIYSESEAQAQTAPASAQPTSADPNSVQVSA